MESTIHVLARAVIIKNDKVLLCRSSKVPFYFLPGGHIEHGEGAADALGRELHEELGFACQVQRFLGCFEYSFVPTDPNKCHSHEYNFLFVADSPDLDSEVVPESPEDHTVFTWVPLITLGTIDFRPHPLKNVLREWLNSNRSDAFASSIE